MLEREQILLRDTLALVVPFEMQKLRQRGGPTDYEMELADNIGTFLGMEGEHLLFRLPHTAPMFADLAWGLAVLSFCPGGVLFLGVRYEAYKSEVA